MKFHWGSKDGGPESRTWMYGLEAKKLGSVLVLKFENGTREAYHNHAFNAVSWLLGGSLMESIHGRGYTKIYWPGVKPIVTKRSTFHQVDSLGRSWALSFRGPWKHKWKEFIPATGETLTLTHGRLTHP